MQLLALILWCVTLAQPVFRWGAEQDTQWTEVKQILGYPAQAQPDGGIKFGMPRSDLHVRVDGSEILPALALGSWAAFRKVGGQAVVMGDLVLREEEVAAVTAKIAAGGLEITALHNHLIGVSPAIMYMHIHGRGDSARLARALKEALSMTATPAPKPPAGNSQELGLDAAQIDAILGHTGKVNNGVLQFGIPRPETIREHGMNVPPYMGVATAINFQPVRQGKAAVTGDFVLIASEVNPVIHALGEHGIAVTALHNHMLDERPRLFFLHFWAKNDATTLARGLRSALDCTASSKKAAR
jgi:hypothetical protein